MICMIIISIAHNYKTEDICFDCEKLEQQIVDGKWKNYNIILTNCLMQRFFEKSEENVNFYLFLVQLEKTIERNTKLIEESFKQDRQHLVGKLSSSKLELETKVSKRKLERTKVKLKRLLEEANIEAVIIESEIRNIMDRCLRPARIGLNQTQHNEYCSNSTNDVFIRVKKLCDKYGAQNALLEVENLRLEIKLQNNKLQSTSFEDS